MNTVDFKIFLLFVFVGYGCQTRDNPITDAIKKEGIIAFGSCNRQFENQELWVDINHQNPNLWIWLGDNIYGDTNDMEAMSAKYDSQNQNIDYQRLKSNTEIIGTWDDHDFGINDGGTGFVQKYESQQLLLDFLEVPKDSPIRRQAGVYTSYDHIYNQVKVKTILLDTRFHRDTIIRTNDGFLPNTEGTVLGGEQWQWLETTLKKSDAAINIIASSIQVIPEEHGYEKWANFPNERQRLFDIIASSNANGVVLISGDRHIAEVSKIDLPGMAYPLYEFTSSGLTHTWKNPGAEANMHRISELIINKNYGLFKLSDKGDSTRLHALINGKGNKNLFSKTLLYGK